MLDVNADDLGRDERTSDSILSCYQLDRIHTASAMAFMRDTRRSALMAREAGLEVGLHLNLIEEFTGDNASPVLRDHHQRVISYLRAARRMTQLVYNPFLRSSFEYDFRAQWDEHCTLYGSEPRRLDGHHHMHLCMNMLASRRIPPGIRVRRNFTFFRGEKNLLNRSFRRLVDKWLEARFRCTDFFFSATPLQTERLRRLIHLSKGADVELMVHPGREDERRFLLGEQWRTLLLEAI
jgi:predicted glycoside hydrolase/deacetylase ChbG (UPF0249 family)